MKYFNSVTGRVEDDGQELPEMESINIPAGRLASPDGSQDINFPVYADALKRERLNSKQLDLAMLENPEQFKFGADLLKSPNQAQEIQPQQEMNPLVKADLMKKFNIQAPKEINRSNASVDPMAPPELAAQKAPGILEQFSPEKYQEALKQMKEQQSNTALAQFGAGVGDALARRDSSGSDRYFQDLRNNIQDQTVGEFNRQKASAIGDVKTKQELAKIDPNSQESQNFRTLVQSTMPNIAKTYGENFKMITAADAPSILDFGKMRETIDARKQQYAMMNSAKNEERFREYNTIYGEARTKDDAKQIKAGSELKTNFDRKLDELIALRKDKGVEYWDREAVARGKQLSKDLLLTYKDMAKLGVLSVSDEKILNAIIPPDPLGQDMVPGQDPILYKLEKFKGDANADFDTRLDNRLLNPSKRVAQSKFPRQVRKGNEVATVSNEEELKEASDEGFN